MAWLIRLLALVAAWILARSVWRWLASRDTRRTSPLPPTHRGTFRRDPVCGAHVDASLAVEAVRDGRTFFFCSDRCREVFAARELTGVGAPK